jgi:hypothetical protein
MTNDRWLKEMKNHIITALLLEYQRGIMHSISLLPIGIILVGFRLSITSFISHIQLHLAVSTEAISSASWSVCCVGIEGSSVGRLRTDLFLSEDLCGTSAIYGRDSRSHGSAGLSADSGGGGRKLVGVRASCTPESLVPLCSILGSVCLESILVGHRKLVAKAAAALVLPLYHELLSVKSADHTVRQVERGLGNRVLCEVVVRLELVHVLGRSNDPERGLILLKQLALLLQTASDQRLGRSVVLVGEGDVGHGAWGSVGVDQDLVVTLDEAVPLKVGSDLLRGAGHVAVHGSRLLSLVADNLVELGQAILDGGDNVGLELSKVVLNLENVVAGVVFINDLLVQAVVDTTLEDIGVLVSADLATGALKGSRVLAKQLDVLLGCLARLVDKLSTFSGALCEFLGLVLDLAVETLEHGEDGTLESLCCFGVRVGDALMLLSFILVSWD